MRYPVHFDTVPFPAHHTRVQLLIRMGIVIVLGIVGAPLGWILGFLYLALPVLAAAAISSEGASDYLSGPGAWLERGLRWLLGLQAYLAFLGDRPPTWKDPGVHYHIERQGAPTAGSALARLLTSIPEAIAYGVLGTVGAALWLVAALFVLFGEGVPRPILSYQRGLLRWQARLLAYHASLVAAYPPLSFDTGDEPEDVPAGRSS